MTLARTVGYNAPGIAYNNPWDQWQMSYGGLAQNAAVAPTVVQNPAAPVSTPAAIPGANPAAVGMPAGAVGLDWNIGTGQLALGALQGGANIWSAIQANNLAEKSLNLQTNFANRNLANSIASYNTRLEDRARARAVTEGQSDSERQAYVDRNRLS